MLRNPQISKLLVAWCIRQRKTMQKQVCSHHWCRLSFMLGILLILFIIMPMISDAEWTYRVKYLSLLCPFFNILTWWDISHIYILYRSIPN